MKILDIIPSTLDEKFNPGNRDYVKTTVPVKNVDGAVLPNSFSSKHLDPVVYTNGPIDSSIGLDFDSFDYSTGKKIAKGKSKKKVSTES